MDSNDWSVTRQMIKDLIEPYHNEIIGQSKLTNLSLNLIDKHLEKLNSKVASHEKAINENLPHTVANCPQSEVIQDIRDNMITENSVLKYKEKSGNFIIAVVSLIIAISSVIAVFVVPAIERHREEQKEIARQKEKTLDELWKEFKSNPRGAVYNYDSTNVAHSDTLE